MEPLKRLNVKEMILLSAVQKVGVRSTLRRGTSSYSASAIWKVDDETEENKNWIYRIDQNI
jgi:hypothetical protein